MKPTPKAPPTKEEAELLERETYERELAALEDVSDDEILARAGGFGPALIGRALHERALAVRKKTGDGVFGPAITDPDYAAKQKALRLAEKRAAAGEDDDDEGDETSAGSGDAGDAEEEAPAEDPWSQVTLSGAKQLAQQHGVSYVPRVKRAALIAQLVAASVPAPAKYEEVDDDDDKERE